MRKDFRDETITKAIRKRNFAYVVNAGLLLSNIILSIKLATNDERWVLIPQFEIEQRYSVHGNQYSSLYLEHWAGALSQDFLSVNPANVDAAAQRFLKIASTHYGQIKPNIDAHVKEIKENNLTTSFYPKEFKVDNSSKIVEVTGSFLTWFGREKAPVEQTKTFLIGWKEGPKGVLLVSQFEERKGE